jgi:cysteine synthase
MTASVHDNVLGLVGQTPMVKLRRLSPPGGAAVWAKLEYLNPGGSVKDRTALGMIEAAEADGRLKPGATIIEPTAGNTGIGLALVGIARGYRVICLMLEKFAEEKATLVRALGGEVVRTPTADGMVGAIRRAHEMAAAMPGAVVLQQFTNPGNPRIHERTTAREIWEQTGGRLDAVVIGAGTGVLVEPVGSIFAGGKPGTHRVEGIGNSSFIPETLDLALATRIMTVGDEPSLAMVRELARQEGLLVGGSSGTACHAAVEVARELSVGQRVVTIFPDAFERYISKRYLDLE